MANKHDQRLTRLEKDAAGSGERKIIVCNCFKEYDICTCDATSAGPDDVIIRVRKEGEQNVRP